MKNKTIIILILAMILVFAFSACTNTEDNQTAANIETTELTVETENNIDMGAKAALAKEEFTIEEMLKYAIEDEYLAKQEYESIMEEYGEQRPFSNIIKAEETHIEMLEEIYDDYGYEMPEDNAIDYVVVPDSIEEALDIGVQAEIDNIAMYEKFLEQDLPDDIRDVFEALRDASESHLTAFEKGVRGNGNGR